MGPVRECASGARRENEMVGDGGGGTSQRVRIAHMACPEGGSVVIVSQSVYARVWRHATHSALRRAKAPSR